jgi:hypothetical protein
MKAMVALAALALLGCDQRPDYWTAFVYPNGSDLGTHFEMPGFKSFEQCQQSAINAIRGFGGGDRSDYECGYKCGAKAGFGGMSVCKETRK